MNKGEQSIVIIEPEYAYGEVGQPPKIPPNSTLVFEITLKDFKDKIKSTWELSEEEKLKEALLLKEKGNNFVKVNDYQKAYEFYKKGIEIVKIE